jgi:hypothetical protein
VEDPYIEIDFCLDETDRQYTRKFSSTVLLSPEYTRRLKHAGNEHSAYTAHRWASLTLNSTSESLNVNPELKVLTLKA